MTGVHGRKWMLGRLKKIDSTADTLQQRTSRLHICSGTDRKWNPCQSHAFSRK